MARLHRRLVALGALEAALLLGLAPPAHAGSVLIEDHAVLEAGHWQLNSVVTVLPNLQRVEGTLVQDLAPGEMSLLNQFTQEIRYGLTEQLMLRTTLPLSMLASGQGDFTSGLGDMELFLKGLLWGGEVTPIDVAAGAQVIWPTSLPAIFATTGGPVLSPSLMATAATPLGGLSANLTYFWALEREEDGRRVQPSDSLAYGLSWDVDLDDVTNVAFELTGVEGYASRLEGAPVAGSAFRAVTAGPSATWLLSPGRSIQASLQLPVYRQGNLADSQPVVGLFQYSVDL